MLMVVIGVVVGLAGRDCGRPLQSSSVLFG
jgi:hypothetical protein